MPRIDDQQAEVKRPFKKKSYRPWNLMDDDFPSTPKTDPKDNQDLSAATITLDTNNEHSVEMPAETHLKASIETSLDLEPKPTAELVTKEISVSNHQVTKYKSTSNQIDNEVESSVITSESISKQISNPISKQPHSMGSSKWTKFYDALSIHDLINRVSGLQRKILFYIVENCILNGTLSSLPISGEELKQLTNADKDTIKTATQRLINKKLVVRGYGKKGKGGFSIFSITEEIRNAVIVAQKKGGVNTGLVTNWLSNKESISTYSSSNNINTTTKERDINNISGITTHWDNLDIEPLASIGFTKSHLRQIIHDDKLASDVVQDSIFAFAFDLEKNDKQKSFKSTPLNYFMGIMRSGTPYAPPPNYESPQDMAMRLYLERKKEMNSKRQIIEEELFQISFSEWEQELSSDERDSILPAQVKSNKRMGEIMAHVRLYFKEQIWPSLREQYISSNSKKVSD